MFGAGAATAARIYRRVISTNTLELVSVSTDASAATSQGTNPRLSDDGCFVLFNSSSPALIHGDTNEQQDIFLWECTNSTIKRINLNNEGHQAITASSAIAITSNGHFAIGLSQARNLVPGDSNEQRDLFLFKLVQGESNTRPSLTISSPAHGSVHDMFFGPLQLVASAHDLEDGNLGSHVTWHSSIDGAVSSPVILSIGAHKLTASVTDSDDNQASHAVSVTVVEHVNQAPSLTIEAPLDDAVILTSSLPLILNATADDIEDGNLTASISWQSDLDGAIASPAYLTVGAHRLSAIVTDADGAAVVRFVDITVTDQNLPPVLSITSPTNGSVSQSGQSVVLTAVASDDHDGVLSAAVQWSSNINGTLGSGSALSVSLSPGTHQITATVSDQQGLISSESISLIVNAVPISYCSARGNNSTYEWINRIAINGVQHLSGNNQGYGNFTSGQNFGLNVGTNSLQLTPGFRSGSYSERWRVWIDLNRDGLFATNEMLYEGVSNTTLTGSLLIPAGTLSGQTRMRVAMSYGSYPASCGAFSWGEVEDYTVTLD